jgi:PIN domain nuclease of toxin-antitoxin system
MVLDTCAVLWLAFNREKFSKSTLDMIDSCENLIVNTLSFWEIGIKLQRKKLIIPLDLKSFIHLFSSNAHFAIIAPDLRIILRTLELPWDHSDPVDRMVVATAMEFNVGIVSGDAVIRKFYKKTFL